jgi:hypothetical protein
MWSNAASHNSADPDGSLIAANASLLRLKISQFSGLGNWLPTSAESLGFPVRQINLGA